MTSSRIEKIISKVAVGSVTIALALGLNYLYAWTAPTANPPANNVSAPINVGTTDQIKNAGLSVNALSVFGSVYVQSALGINDVSPQYALDIKGPEKVGGASADLSTGAITLTNLQNVGAMLIGWNKSAGGGETDFIANRASGSTGGFNFYDYSNGGVLTSVMSIPGSGGLKFPDASAQTTSATDKDASSGNTYLFMNTESAGPPPAADCNADAERGRLSIDTTNNRLYICNGAARAWDYVTLTN